MSWDDPGFRGIARDLAQNFTKRVLDDTRFPRPRLHLEMIGAMLGLVYKATLARAVDAKEAALIRLAFERAFADDSHEPS